MLLFGKNNSFYLVTLKKAQIKIAIIVIFLIFFSWFSFHTIFITLSGLQNNIYTADVAVVLGNEVRPDGQPSDRLKARLNKAVELFDQKQTYNFIVSGGTGKEGQDEAKVMAKYLIDKSIPAENIFIDSQGITTEATAENSVKIMNENNWHSVIIVSQYFHIARTKLAFQKQGIAEIYSASANYFELRDLYSIGSSFRFVQVEGLILVDFFRRGGLSKYWLIVESLNSGFASIRYFC
jgi:vancomycin permeability regulator SanA